MKRLVAAFLLLPLLLSCKSSSLFKARGSHLAAPISVAVDVARNRAYVVNSNLRTEFDSASFSILDITTPTSPALFSSSLNPITLPNFSGQIYYDAVNRLAFTPNRLSSDPTVLQNILVQINVDEASASFGTRTDFAGGENPFGAACCDGSGRLYVVSNGGSGTGTVEVYNPASPSTFTQISLNVALSIGQLSGRNSTEVVLKGGTQAFVTNRGGFIYVLNTAEVGDTSKNPIDYVIINGGDFRGIATDGTLLYVVDATGGTPILRVINPASLTPVSPDAAAPTQIDISTIQTKTVALGNDPNEIVLFGGRAYVTNRADNTVSVIDLTSVSAVTTIGVGTEPYGLAAFTSGGGGNLLYVTNLASNSISIIDLASNSVAETFSP